MIEDIKQWFANYPIATNIIKYLASNGKVILASATFEIVKIPTLNLNKEQE